jgi:FKBP-type peptidyl-prolyl cis-trans isomerase (trigger factor)
MTDNQPTTTIKKLANSTVEIESSLSVEELNRYREPALKKLGEEITLDGFRKNHIPEKILEEKIGAMTILNQMVELALSDTYPLIVTKNNLAVIGQPHITITKMTLNQPVEFKITSAILPEFDLPDYQAIARTINSKKEGVAEVTEEELASAIKQIQKISSRPLATPTEESKTTEVEAELTDASVKKLGSFKDVADFKAKLKENLYQEKKNKAQEAQRVKIMDALLTEIKLTLPEIIIQEETERLFNQTKSDIAQMGLNFEKYLEHLKKTAEELKQELRPDAEKRAKIQFILDKIIKAEQIEADPIEVTQNIEYILKQHPEAKQEVVRSYVEMVLSNQAVFKLLEKQ